MKLLLCILYMAILCTASFVNRSEVLQLYDQYYVIEDNPSLFVKSIQPLVKTNPCAQYILGNCYMRGNGVSQNRTKAIELWKQAYQKGHPVAARNLAISYETLCPNEALEYAENGCKWGSGHSCVVAGTMWSGMEYCVPPTTKGCFCPNMHDYETAMKYYMQGLNLGCPAAAFLIGEDAFDDMEPVLAAGYFGAAYFDWGVGDGYDGNWMYYGLINSLTQSELSEAEDITQILLKKYPKIRRNRVQLTRDALNLSIC